MSKKYPGVRERGGRFTFRYDVEEVVDGRTQRKQKETPAFPTAKAAYEEGIRIKAKQLDGDFVDEKNMLFEKWVEKWLEIYENSGRKEHSVDTRRTSLYRPLQKFTGKKLKDITAFQYQSLLDEMKKDGLSKNTLISTHSTMSMLFSKAVKPPYSLIQRDITNDIEFPSFTLTVEQIENMDVTARYMEREQLITFLDTAKVMGTTFSDQQFARIMYVLSYTGMRIGELCALETKDLDEVNRKIRIIKTIYAKEGSRKYRLNSPKTKTSIRDIGITKDVISILNQQEKEKREFRMSRADKYYTGRDFVFVNNKKAPGYPLCPRDIQDQMRRILARCGLPESLTPHALRHTYTSLSAEAGIKLESIQRQLGHANDVITSQVYYHVTKSQHESDMEKLEAFINRRG